MKKQPDSYHHKNLREALILQTSMIISEEGQEIVTMRELARRLGVSRTAPYRHFEDKDALLAAVARRGFQRMNLIMLRVFETHQDKPLQQFRYLIAYYLSFAARSKGHYALMFGPIFQQRRRYPRLAEAADETFAILAQVISLCQAREQMIASDPAVLAHIVWASLHGMASLHLDEPGDPDEQAKEKIRLTFETLISGLKPRAVPAG